MYKLIKLSAKEKMLLIAIAKAKKTEQAYNFAITFLEENERLKPQVKNPAYQDRLS